MELGGVYPVKDSVHHPSLGGFSMVDVSTAGIVPVPTRSALERSRRELSEDVSFGVGTLLAVEQSSLEKPPQGCVEYTVLCGKSSVGEPVCIK